MINSSMQDRVSLGIALFIGVADRVVSVGRVHRILQQRHLNAG